MHFSKPALSISDQITLLKSRGMLMRDQQIAENWLASVSYYRMSAYWLPYEKKPLKGKTRSKEFIEGVSFDDVMELYIFDRQLRLMIMEAVERIEIALRARWTHFVVMRYGSHAHLDSTNFDLNYRKGIYWRVRDSVIKNSKVSDEVFIKHYNRKYSSPACPPLWAATELFTFGEMSIWLSLTKDNQIKDLVARDLGFRTSRLLEGAIQNISLVRNKCAHHSRVWNRKFTKRVRIVNELSESMMLIGPADKVQVDNRIYNTLVVLIHMLKQQAPHTSYPSRLSQMVRLRSKSEQSDMGFPIGWEALPIWN